MVLALTNADCPFPKTKPTTQTQVVDPVTGFSSWSGLCSDHVSGVWSADTTSPMDVMSCCRSLEGGLLVTSDARGDVKLFR